MKLKKENIKIGESGITLENILTNITNLQNNKISTIKMSEGRYIKNIDLAYYNNRWCLKVVVYIDGLDRTMYFYNDAFIG